jgi:glycosyltransferase involved in cell wall biosynthesis
MSNQQTKLKVSVIIPTYNRAHCIGEAVETVRAQAYCPVEIIVVDDGSTDETRDVLRQYAPDIQYIYQQNAGPPCARNRGLDSATGDVIAFLDSDDLWPADKIKHQISILNSDPAADIVLGCLRYCEFTTGVTHDHELRFLSEPQLAYNLGAAMIRKSVFDRVGNFDPQLRFSDDWDWFVRAIEMDCHFAKTPKVTLYNRRHADNLSNQQEIGNHYTLRMLKKTLDRRRNNT